jgi:hypothetical protein
MRRLIILTFLAGLLLIGLVFAESYPPTPRPAPASKSSQQISKADKEKSYITNESLRVAFHQIHTEAHASDTNKKPADWWFIGLTICLIAIGIGQACIYWNQLIHFRRTDRAYVRINSNPPGVRFSDKEPIACTFTIKNYGETPAHITDIFMKAEVTPQRTLLPYPPDFSGTTKYPCSAAFLVRGDSLSYNPDLGSLTAEQFQSIKIGTHTVSLYGYVDYIDAFGQRHRGQFGQNYYAPNDNKGDGMSNLTFLMQKGYNDDKKCPKS